MAYLDSPGVQPQANVGLPAHVVASEGELTLFADYAHADERGVPLYLVNRTSQNLSKQTQDVDWQIKLEVKHPDGSWRRAETHRFRNCGVGSPRLSLPPGCHLIIAGYRPKRGAEGQVRYLGYGSLKICSNEGVGLFSEGDLEAAQYDRMSLRGVPSCLVDFIPEKDSLPPLVEPPWKVKVAAMRLLRVLGGVPAARRECESLAGQLQLQAKNSTEKSEALAVLRELLSQSWPAEMDKAGLLKSCFESLTGERQAGAAFGSLDESPDLIWKVLSELGRGGWSGFREVAAKDLWKAVLKLAASRINSAPREQQLAMGDLLGIAELVDEVLPDAVFEAFLARPNDDSVAHEVAANVLARRGRWERLVELSWSIRPESQLKVLLALASCGTSADSYSTEVGGVRSPNFDTEEERFWVHCMTSQPLAASVSLHGLIWGQEWNPFPATVKKPLLEYWRRQAAESDQLGADFDLGHEGYRLVSSLELLGSWRSHHLAALDVRDEVPVLRSLLTHRGFEIRHDSRSGNDGGSINYRTRQYVVRAAAKKALEKLDEAVPEGVVLEMELPPEPSGTPKTGP